MNYKEILNGTVNQDPDLMRKIIAANDCIFTECLNDIKRAKAIINYHTSTYVFQQSDQYNAAQLTGALVDLKGACEMIINKLNEIK